jgi:ketosteroid isomerase-like protein
VIERLQEAYRKAGGDPSGWAEILDPDIEFVDYVLQQGRSVRGREAFLRLLAGFSEASGRVTYEAERLVPAGNRVAVVVRVEGSRDDGDGPVTVRIGHVLELRDDCIVRITAWPDPETALRAVEEGRPEG